jgi:putative holliday junction resolvase
MSTSSARALAIDLGSRRIGLAVSDRSATMAFPFQTLERSGDPVADHRELVAAVRESGAVTIVVGLPRSLDGSDGPAARAARQEAEALRRSLSEGGETPVEVVLFDERLTTVSANAQLSAGGIGSRDRRAVIDQVAATVLLQAWIDGGRPRS